MVVWWVNSAGIYEQTGPPSVDSPGRTSDRRVSDARGRLHSLCGGCRRGGLEVIDHGGREHQAACCMLHTAHACSLAA